MQRDKLLRPVLSPMSLKNEAFRGGAQPAQTGGTRQTTMCKASELICQLSEEEQVSLKEIGRGPARRKIPHRHAERFIELGLAELLSGYQELTIVGKRAVSLITRPGTAGV